MEPTELEEKIFASLKALATETQPLRVPAPMYDELGMCFESFIPGKGLTASFSIQERFTNAVGSFAQGLVGAAFEAAYDVCALLLAHRPCTVVSLNVDFFRPLTTEEKRFLVEVRVRGKARGIVFFEGKAATTAGQIFAVSTAVLSPLPRGEADNG